MLLIHSSTLRHVQVRTRWLIVTFLGAASYVIPSPLFVLSGVGGGDGDANKKLLGHDSIVGKSSGALVVWVASQTSISSNQRILYQQFWRKCLDQPIDRISSVSLGLTSLVPEIHPSWMSVRVKSLNIQFQVICSSLGSFKWLFWTIKEIRKWSHEEVDKHVLLSLPTNHPNWMSSLPSNDVNDVDGVSAWQNIVSKHRLWSWIGHKAQQTRWHQLGIVLLPHITCIEGF